MSVNWTSTWKTSWRKSLVVSSGDTGITDLMPTTDGRAEAFESPRAPAQPQGKHNNSDYLPSLEPLGMCPLVLW